MRHLFFSRKKKRAAFADSSGTYAKDSPCFVKEKRRNADVTDPCVAAKLDSTFFHFSCVHRVVLGYGQGPPLVYCTPNERQSKAGLPVFFRALPEKLLSFEFDQMQRE